MAESPDTPLDDNEFTGLMARFEPFESARHLAVAVSGGADSLALTLLAARWAGARGGRVSALTVDHGLRPESAAEARRVGDWLAARGIAHHILVWGGEKPRAGIQAAARIARLDLLRQWCRASGALHLLLAHQRDDQVETLVLRLARQSGPEGLAAMAQVVEMPELRLLRPVLGVPHARLLATLRAAGQPWIEDPSNDDPRFARVRVRQMMPNFAADGVSAEALAEATRRLGQARQTQERAVAALLARAATIHPEGWATLDPAVLVAAPRGLSQQALSRVVGAIGGGGYPPRNARLDRLHAALVDNQLAGGRTLAGCRILPRAGAILVVREAAAIQEIPLSAPGTTIWEDRFAITVAGRAMPPGVRLARLGSAGWAAIVRDEKNLRLQPVPAPARLALPALWDLEGVREVPHLMYRRRGADADSVRVEMAQFRPRRPLAGPGFATFI